MVKHQQKSKNVKFSVLIPTLDRDRIEALKRFLKDNDIEYEIDEDYESVMQMSFL
jgi:hypothetical protein